MTAAGPLSEWLAEMQSALRGESDARVPCDGCTACCRSSQFITVGPDESETLAHIPRALLFPAPNLPPGHVVFGYDERGHCPMLVDDACSIYEHRPRACRTYDCRVFAATGITPDQPAVAERVQRWVFEDDDPDLRAALEAAAAHVRARGDTTNPTEIAVRALAVHDAEQHLGR
jgi:Fe-S-cluster containining protein